MPPNTQQQNDFATLSHMATQVSSQFPDMRQMARELAQKVLEKHDLGTLEPDQVYFHRFHRASSSPRTYSGWQHQERPYQSMTLPQLAMTRFTPAEQEASDLLNQYTGFYTQDPSKPPYDESNEIRLAPLDVLNALWEADLSTAFHSRMERFWEQYGDDYRTLAKVTFLSKVLETRAQTDDSKLAWHALQAAQALTGVQQWPASLTELRETCLPTGSIRLRTFDIGGHLASDILRLVRDDGSVLLYTPGEERALQLFADDRDVFAWVLAQTRDSGGRARFLSHFPLASHAQNDSQTGLVHLLDILRRTWDAHGSLGLNKLDRLVQQDAFSWLRDAARSRMRADAHFALRSNASLRKQRWLRYLQSFNQVFGPLALGDWPIALLVTGAGLAETGLDIDQAINGATTAERQAGRTAAMIDGIATLFNASLLFKAGVNAEGRMPTRDTLEPAGIAPFEYEAATAAELQAWVPEPFAPAASDALLETLESNDIITTLPGDRRFTGVISEQGKFYAMVGDQTYQVRFINELDTWAIIDPASPFSFVNTLPLQADAAGTWRTIPRLGLKGGTPRVLLKAWGRLQPKPALPALEPTPYEVPQDQRASLRTAANGEQDTALAYQDAPAYALYRNLRDSLEADSQRFFAEFECPPRTPVPDLPPNSTGKAIANALYQNQNGLVIGESHVQRGARQFLINNLRYLRQQGVKVIYLEHFMTDFQQIELDEFNRTGTLPAALKAYVEDFDAQANLFEATPYTLKRVLYTAHAQGVRAQAIDCLASYRQAWHETPALTTRQEMMNYYAHRIIALDQATRGASKWVALVGDSHANRYMGIPGLADLEGVIGLRVEDIEIGRAARIGSDPGSVREQQGLPVSIRSDLLLQVPLIRPWM